MARATETVFKCFLATESVRVVGPFLRGKMNRGSLGSAGMAWIMAVRADMGQRSEEPRKGRGRVTVSLRFWMVFDHFMRRRPFCGCVMKSPRANCLVESKEWTECGRMLEILRNEKKHVRYNGLKTKEYSMVSDW